MTFIGSRLFKRFSKNKKTTQCSPTLLALKLAFNIIFSKITRGLKFLGGVDSIFKRDINAAAMKGPWRNDKFSRPKRIEYSSHVLEGGG